MKRLLQLRPRSRGARQPCRSVRNGRGSDHATRHHRKRHHPCPHRRLSRARAARACDRWRPAGRDRLCRRRAQCGCRFVSGELSRARQRAIGDYRSAGSFVGGARSPDGVTMAIRSSVKRILVDDPDLAAAIGSRASSLAPVMKCQPTAAATGRPGHHKSRDPGAGAYGRHSRAASRAISDQCHRHRHGFRARTGHATSLRHARRSGRLHQADDPASGAPARSRAAASRPTPMSPMMWGRSPTCRRPTKSRSPRTIADALRLHPELVQDRQQSVGMWRRLRRDAMQVALQLAPGVARQKQRQPPVIMHVRVAIGLPYSTSEWSSRLPSPSGVLLSFSRKYGTKLT